jgi:outer membrane lipoprotein-sorting protein
MLRRLLLAAVAAPVVFCAVASAQSLDDIVSKHVAAMGGLDKIKAVKTIRQTGKATVGPGIVAPVTLSMARPNAFRMELSIQGKTLIQATDGSTAWMMNPFAGATAPEKMSADDAKELNEMADIDGALVDWKAKGHTVEFIGKEDFEGTEVLKLKVVLKSGETKYTYLDASTFLVLKETGKRKREGAELDVETVFGDYKTVEGLTMPFSIEAKAGGQPQFQMTMDKIELNPTLDPAVFTMPAAAAPAVAPAKTPGL